MRSRISPGSAWNQNRCWLTGFSMTVQICGFQSVVRFAPHYPLKAIAMSRQRYDHGARSRSLITDGIQARAQLCSGRTDKLKGKYTFKRQCLLGFTVSAPPSWPWQKSPVINAVVFHPGGGLECQAKSYLVQKTVTHRNGRRVY